jgi:hypothetical protein
MLAIGDLAGDNLSVVISAYAYRSILAVSSEIRGLTMRRFVTLSMFVSVLLTAAVCLAQDNKSDAAGAKADAPAMWEAYKKMWEGKWETTITMPNGEEVTAKSTVEVILNGKAVLSSATWTYQGGTLNIKSIGSWCPKRKSIVVHTVGSDGGQSEAVITLDNGEERGSTSFIDADGTEESNKSVVTLIDPDTIKVTFLEGRFAGGEFTWKREKM